MRKELTVIYELLEIVFSIFQRCIKEDLSPFFPFPPKNMNYMRMRSKGLLCSVYCLLARVLFLRNLSSESSRAGLLVARVLGCFPSSFLE